MSATKDLFFEPVYNFQSERWNEFELSKLSMRELQALARAAWLFCLRNQGNARRPPLGAT